MAEHKSLLERILHITEGWFLTEPALFCIFCTHELVENSKMHIPIRTGKGKVEFNQFSVRGMPKTGDGTHFP